MTTSTLAPLHQHAGATSVSVLDTLERGHAAIWMMLVAAAIGVASVYVLLGPAFPRGGVASALERSVALMTLRLHLQGSPVVAPKSSRMARLPQLNPDVRAAELAVLRAHITPVAPWPGRSQGTWDATPARASAGVGRLDASTYPAPRGAAVDDYGPSVAVEVIPRRERRDGVAAKPLI